MYRGSHRVAEAVPTFAAHALLRVPQRIKRMGAVFEHCNALWLARQVGQHMRSVRPDLVWLTHPDLEPAVARLEGVKLVYDCMDDHLAFHSASATNVATSERRLLERANLTLFSSQTLAQRVRRRSTVRRGEVVNNGLAESLLARLRDTPAQPRTEPTVPGWFTLGYFGTLSHWFDWPLMLHLLQALPQARLVLAGPIEGALPEHPRISHVGLLPHAGLANFAAGCDALVMPFMVSTLIEAVDPVKLYEYIALNLPALAPRYAESARFEPWVQLYRGADEAIALVRRMAACENPPTSRSQRLSFLEANTWAARGQQIESALQSLFSPLGRTAPGADR
jgi:glycosyltransferase involved in cell wall biosynthesis